MSLWSPSQKRVSESLMFQYMKKMGKNSYSELHQWSVERNEDFWESLFDYFEVNYQGESRPANPKQDFLNYEWFENVKLNFAENLLRFKNSNHTALHLIHESGLKKKISYQELYQQVASVQKELSKYIKKGDVVAAYMPNTIETVVTMLATTSLGGVFTSTSSDFGVGGVIDRFGQSQPKVMVSAVSYQYNGKTISQIDKLEEIKSKLEGIEKIITVDFLNSGLKLAGAISWEEILKEDGGEIAFELMKFSDPLYIMYSSGTTGKPKCIVHSTGGVLLQHLKELGLHCNLTPEKKIFYFTTCGWMMWNWLVSSLYFGAEVVLYEGSPAYPSLESFMKKIDEEKINIWGTSPKFLKALESYTKELNCQFDSLETILSTGAPLMPEQFDYVYKNIKSDVQLSSISGGTDILGCFMLGNPILPVKRGEIQCLGLGMDVSCFNEKGEELIGVEGELVCRKSFPSQPLGFLNDDSQEKFRSAYFDKFDGIWYHGDFVTITKEKSVIVYGRSDATLNPGGVRIGTAEIYRQIEKLEYIDDGLCVGKQVDGDVEVVLFVKLKESEKLSDSRVKEIKTQIKSGTTPRHVPSQVFQVKNIPYTRSGKKMELAVTRVINGRELTNLEAMSDPKAIEEYKEYV